MRIPHRTRRRPACWTIKLKDLDRLLLPLAIGAAVLILLVILLMSGWTLQPFRL